MKTRPSIMAVPLGASKLCIIFQSGLNNPPDFSLKLDVGAALFQVFADVEATDEAIDNFRRDVLKTSGEISVCVYDRDSGTTVMEIPAPNDPNQNWKEEILAMRRCIALWNLIRDENAEELKKFVKWESHPSRGLSVVCINPADPDPSKATPSPGEREVIASEVDSAFVMRQLSAGDVIGPARIYLERQINDRLKDGVLPRMFAPLSPRSRVHANPTHELHLIPKHFVAAAWLQLASAISNGSRFVRCRECETRVEVARGNAHEERR